MSTQPRSWLSQPLHAFGTTWLGQFASALGLGLSNSAISVRVKRLQPIAPQSFFEMLRLLAYTSVPPLQLAASAASQQ